MPEYSGVLGLLGEASVLNPAPSVASSAAYTQVSGITAHNVPTAGYSWAAGKLLDTVMSIGSSPTLDTIAGDTDDTATAVANGTATPKLYLTEWAVVGGTLDTNLVHTLSASSRAVVRGLVYTGAVGRTAVAVTSNTGTALLSPAITVTGGPRNVLALSALNLLGAHSANAPAPEVDWTLFGPDSSTGDAPALTSRSTLAVAYKVFAAGDLTWTAGSATIPAMQWTADDHVAQDWNALGWGMLS